MPPCSYPGSALGFEPEIIMKARAGNPRAAGRSSRPELAFALLAVNGKRSPFRDCGFLHHLLSFIRVTDTHAWGKPVYSSIDDFFIASSDTAPDTVWLHEHGVTALPVPIKTEKPPRQENRRRLFMHI